MVRYQIFISDPGFWIKIFFPPRIPDTNPRATKKAQDPGSAALQKMGQIKFKMITLLTASPGLGVSSSLVWSLSISRTSSPTSTTASPQIAFQDPNPSYDFYETAGVC
jgi:hypothetical protein